MEMGALDWRAPSKDRLSRVWKTSQTRLEVGVGYFDRGPHRSMVAADVLSRALNAWEQFEFHWTVADYIGAILAAGCTLVDVEEFRDAGEPWEAAPMAGLPASLLLVGRRNG